MRSLAMMTVMLASALVADRADAADWTGGHFGLNAGALRSEGDASRDGHEGDLLTLDVANGLFPADIGDADTSATGGVSLGYDIQRGSLVTGVEIDFAFTNSDVRNGFSKRDPNPDPVFNGVNTITGYGTELDTLATLRLRAGYATGETLLYVTGGLAAGQVKNSFSLDLTELGYSSDWSASDTRFGYVVGGGVERMMSDRFSVKAEVLHYDLSDKTVRATDPATFPGQSIAYKFDNSGVVGRVGLNIAF